MKSTLIARSLIASILLTLGFQNAGAQQLPLSQLTTRTGRPLRFNPRDILSEKWSNVESLKFIYPKNPVSQFSQWGGNAGYCGEVSLIQAAMNQGEWMSQFNARLICGAGLSQSGPDGFCATHQSEANYNAQLSFENPKPGDAAFSSAGLCLANSHLSYEVYDYQLSPPGMAGYQRYLSWVKAQTIAGHQVTIAILNWQGDDPQYDHEVTVAKIGTNHSVQDPTYYDDDVLFFDDHAKSSLRHFTFASMAKSRDEANRYDANTYSILIPGGSIYSKIGGDGINTNPNAVIAANYGFSVAGPLDPKNETLPVTLSIVGSSTDGSANSSHASFGFNYESPGIESSCSNSPPTSWMKIDLEVNVSNLEPGKYYNLYEYDTNAVHGTGALAALAVPDSDFAAHAQMAAHVTRFLATSAHYTQGVTTTSDKVVVFRCVKTQ